ncbi:MAG: DNA/RNA nuclease SfsA [Clostridiales bacterium]|mgnify:CR=1 FL=1|nr:DNA/RNA nuclease SfsA [Clostridiales bacterium]
MKYKGIKRAEFINRPNRFIANVEIDGKREAVHVKNTGRCKEIFTEGATVILEKATNPNRKTRYSVIAGYKGDLLINTDSQVPNTVVYDALVDKKIMEIQSITHIKREVTFGKSRFDIYFEKEDKKGFIEVKGVTLEDEGICKFPDAPTQRGAKHIYELIEAKRQGYSSYIFFLVQMEGMKYFTPNDETDPEFGQALRLAKENDVEILVYDSLVKEDEIVIGESLDYII